MVFLEGRRKNDPSGKRIFLAGSFRTDSHTHQTIFQDYSSEEIIECIGQASTNAASCFLLLSTFTLHLERIFVSNEHDDEVVGNQKQRIYFILLANVAQAIYARRLIVRIKEESREVFRAGVMLRVIDS